LSRIAHQIQQQLAQGGTLIAPSPQRALALRVAFETAQIEQGRCAWRTPDVIGYRTWLERETARAVDAGVLQRAPLKAAEEWAVWRAATSSAAASIGVPLREHLPESLRRAARLLGDWRIPPAVLDRGDSAEAALLARALAEVAARTRAARALASHDFAPALEPWNPRAALTFAGFSEVTAARARLVAAWSARAISIRTERAQGPPGEAGAVAAGEAGEELELAARWACARLAAAPAARLLVIVPDLASRRAEVVRGFQEALDSSGLANRDPERPAWMLETGAPLSEHALVRHALLGLRLLAGTLDFEDCGAWLRAAFWSAPAPTLRARIEAWLRTRAVGVDLSAAELVSALGHAAASLAAPAATLREALSAAERALAPLDEPASHREWSRRFAAALAALGWPGGRALTSAEQQARERFDETLGDLACAGPHLGAATARDALRTLESLTARTAFAPASGDVPITLSPALADPIARYTGIWVTGLHADAWPPRVHSDPYVPLEAQARAGVPRITPQQALRGAAELLETWRCRTDELIVSSPLRSGEEELLASPLLAALPPRASLPGRERHEPLARWMRASRRMEALDDSRGNPWPRLRALPSGSRSLDYQSRCPFRAYTELRLACVPLESPHPGIDSRERGRFLHRALELLWRRLGDSRALRAASDPSLAALIEACVAEAAASALAAPSRHAPPPAQRRERARAVRLLRELAALELRRPEFRVTALEQECTLELGGARLELRIDRIDELEERGNVLLDYKTGRPSAPGWLSERIVDPQLIAYLLAVPGAVVALATVQLCDGAVRYRGLSDRPERLPQLEALERARGGGGAQSAAATVAGGEGPDPRAWRAQIDRWREQLTSLARAFLAGEAAVDPAENACRVCHLQTLCRIGQSIEPQELTP